MFIKSKETKKTKKEIIAEKGYNPWLIQNIQPQGGICFNNDDRYTVTGDGYEACLKLYEYSEKINMHWLANILNIQNVVSVLDISSENMTEVRKNINRSIKEQISRHESAKDATDRSDAEARYDELMNIYQEISSMDEIIKLIKIRLYIAAKTYNELEERVKEITDQLEKKGYKAAIFLNEQANDWKAMYLPYKKQGDYIQEIEGNPYPSETLAGGNPFHFTSLNDEHGSYYGQTVSTNGAVLLDMFEKNKKRLSYNAICFGKMGSGKSTLLKKMCEDRAIRGDFIRGFDVSGEWTGLVRKLGGKVVSLDGSDGRLNPFEILKTHEEEKKCYTQHIGKLSTMYKFWNPDHTGQELYLFESLLSDLYIKMNLIDSQGNPVDGKITGLKPERYPIMSDFKELLTARLVQDYEHLPKVQKEIMIEELKLVSSIKIVIESLINNCGDIFDGITTMENILDSQIVFFNIQGLVKMQERVFDSQIFSALSLCYDNLVKVGTLMKDGYEKYQKGEPGGIAWEDITRFLILFDESHRVINANKLEAVDQVITYEREARKYFGGITLASQSVNDYVPEGSSQDSINKIKTLFELSQYKFIMQQDTNASDVLRNVFKNELTEDDIEIIPQLEMGETILCISGMTNIHFNIYITEEEQQLFAGGA